MASESSGDRLPFEPKRDRKKRSSTIKAQAPTPSSGQSEVKASPAAMSKTDRSIPEVVNRRMLRRMAIFCGLPTSAGMGSIFLGYVIVSRHLFTLPNTAVLLVSLGFFGLGVLGLTYGALSASWDEERIGTWLGWKELTLNWGRLTGAWQEERESRQTNEQPNKKN
jgi:hypothetical protein